MKIASKMPKYRFPFRPSLFASSSFSEDPPGRCAVQIIKKRERDTDNINYPPFL